MHLVPHRVLRRAAVYGSLITLLGLAATSLTQCTMVQDNLTGVSLSDARVSPCLRDCQHEFDRAIREEFRLFKRNRRECNEDPVCLAIETERHRLAVQAITATYEQCLQNCHHQGGGSGS